MLVVISRLQQNRALSLKVRFDIFLFICERCRQTLQIVVAGFSSSCIKKHSSPGRLGRLLRAQGCELDCRRACFGDPLPKTLRDYAGAIVFGGPMSVNDEDAWLRREIDWIGVPLKEDTPFLGICLGAQMLARHLGHGVRPHPQGRVEVGYYPIQPTEQGHGICDCRFPNHVYQWHREGFDLPGGRCCWPRARISRRRPSAIARRPTASNSIRK